MGQKTRNSVVVNGSGGALVTIAATTFARNVEIQEDNAAPQGLSVTWPDGTVSNYPASNQPVVLGNKGGQLGGATGALVGIPANYNGSGTNAATVYCQVRSMTATATSVRVVEQN